MNVGEPVDVLPHPLVGGVEQVRAVDVHLDAGLGLGLAVGVAAEVVAALEDEHLQAELAWRSARRWSGRRSRSRRRRGRGGRRTLRSETREQDSWELGSGRKSSGGWVADPHCAASPAPRDGPDHIARLGAAAAQRAERDDRRGDQPGLGAHQRVLAVPEVDHEEVAVHVEPLPACRGACCWSKSSWRTSTASRTAQMRKPGPAGAHGEVDVVVEDEVRRVGQPDRVDHPPVHHEALEGDVLDLAPARASASRVAYTVSTLAVLGRIASGLRRSKCDRGLLDQVAGEVLAHRHQAGLVVGQQHGQAVGGRHDVVVHQPDPVVARVVGLLAPRGGSRRRRRGCSSLWVTCSGRSVRAAEHLGGCGRCWRCRRR